VIRPGLHDATGLGMRASRALIEASVEGDCLLCNRPRDLDPLRGGCRCIAVDPQIEELEIRERIARAFAWRRELARESRLLFWERARLWGMIALLVAAFVLLAVL